MSLATNANNDQQRIIGRWTIGDTLGKGGYSWVKRGQDIKTGKIVALKFMEKADVSWVKEQAKQVETEIEALKNIRHQNVMKLYAYNLNAQYPLAKNDKNDTHGNNNNNNNNNSASTTDPNDPSATATATATATDPNAIQYLDTILLVLEYAPGGELFDILYYTSALAENVGRTYFKQIISGLEACHNNGVVHRDLKPQNLLLDAKYNLKITDFGLSKIIQSDADAIMKTTYVGTKGYQAPELLLNKKYDLKCDIFSVGVILFILLAGYPPFEQASKNDKWFKPLMKGNIDKFWKAHHKSPIAKNAVAKDLLQQMLAFDPSQRIDINGIKNHSWYAGPTLKQKELIQKIRDRHRKAEKKRRLDVRKMNDLANSIGPGRPIKDIEKAKLDLFPANDHEGIYSDVYTYLDVTDPPTFWYDIFNFIQEAITGDKGHGTADFNFDTNILHCEMKIAKKVMATTGKAVNTEQTIKFTVQVWKSRVWDQKYLDAVTPFEPDEIKQKNEHQIYIVRIVRKEGDTMVFRDVKNNFLLLYCGNILKGLPKWALKMDSQLNALSNDPKPATNVASTNNNPNVASNNVDQDDMKDDNNTNAVDDYEQIVAGFNWDNPAVNIQ